MDTKLINTICAGVFVLLMLIFLGILVNRQFSSSAGFCSFLLLVIESAFVVMGKVILLLSSGQ